MVSRADAAQAFVGPEQPIHGLEHARFGNLAVILRNGKVHKVMRPGNGSLAPGERRPPARCR